MTITLFAALTGFAILLRYSGQQGAPGHVPRRFPAAAAEVSDSSRPTLLLFAHPQCPCSRATFAELERIAAHCDRKVRMVASFFSPPELGEERVHGELWAMASRIPGLEIREDRDGALARAFGVETSGHALLYAADGRLLFEGGITSARGHEGDNEGKASILSVLLGGTPLRASTPVFGCSLGLGTAEEEKSHAP